jgi:hypothetical protein
MFKWKNIASATTRVSTHLALLVDIADQVDERGEADAGIRRREYREQGLVEIVTKATTGTS